MSPKKEKNCIICGVPLKAAQNNRPKKYCSSKCSNKVHNQKNAGREKFPAGTPNCTYCGKIFVRPENSVRHCCSRKCAYRFNRQKEIEQIRNLANAVKHENKHLGFRDFVLDIYFGGHSRMAIADALGLTENTIENWARRYEKDMTGTWRRKKDTPIISAYKQYSYQSAATAEDWVMRLRKNRNHKIKENVPVGYEIVIACEYIDTNKGVDSLVEIIQTRLQKKLMEKIVFAFCGKRRDKIRYIYHNGKGFSMVSHRCETGMYPWPSPKYGESITITREDFELILYSESDTKYGANIYDWDNLES